MPPFRPILLRPCPCTTQSGITTEIQGAPIWLLCADRNIHRHHLIDPERSIEGPYAFAGKGMIEVVTRHDTVLGRS